MSLRDVFVDASPSGCCFGKLCKFGAEAAASLAECGSCGSKMHRLCAAEKAWLKWLDPESTAVACFECRLLEALLDGTALPAQLAVYYRQQVDWSRVGTANVSPFTIGAILATDALLLQQVCKTSQRARLAPPTGKCKKCKQVGALVGCSFCTAVYHNSDACLGEAKVAAKRWRRWLNRPRSRGRARHASRRASRQSNALSSSRRASARQVPSASAASPRPNASKLLLCSYWL